MLLCLLSLIRRPPIPTPFPYTTLFRSAHAVGGELEGRTLGGAQRGVLLGEGVLGLRHDPDEVVLGERLQLDPEGEATLQLGRSEEHTSELQSHSDLVCRLLLEKKNNIV